MTEKEIVILMLRKIEEEPDEYKRFGLCFILTYLTLSGVITQKEREKTFLLMLKHRPIGIVGGYAGYWWVADDFKPRIKFLKQLKKELENG